MLRCIRIFWIQQRSIDRSLLTAMLAMRRESQRESAENAATLERETTRMREELTTLVEAVRALETQAGQAGLPVADQHTGKPDDTN